MNSLIFSGAAREVTGSLHLVQSDGVNIALDCGIFHGRRAETEAKNRNFPVEPRDLNAVVLTHAHIDHSGRLPLLVKRDFEGPIYSTPATRDLCAIMLADSAHIQEEDSRFLNKKRAPAGEPLIEPLYDDEDTAATMTRFRSFPLGQTFELTPKLRCTLHQAGHMLGSCSIRLEFQDGDATPRSLLYTGDLGRPNTPILRDPEPLPPSDYLIIESTYGGRRHPQNVDLMARLEEIVRATIERGGKLIIPAFSVGRTQTIVYMLHQLEVEGRIPRIPVYIDSPLAVNASEIFRLHPELFDAEAREFLRLTGDILGAESCHYVRDAEESKKLNSITDPIIIVSASGMCENGRIVHHIRNNVQSTRNTILIVGFQAAHTLGRRLVEKQPRISIFGQQLKVKARIEICNGFSGHADRDELAALYKPLAKQCRAAFLVHGEPDQMDAMAADMRAAGFDKVHCPAPGDSFALE